jgi:hypothetical protein
MSKLDQIYGYARAVSGPGEQQHYLLGAELFYRIWNYVKDKLLSDCSGSITGLWKRTGTLFFRWGYWLHYETAFRTQRPTAHAMYVAGKTWGTVFDDPALLVPGDLAVKVRKVDDHATHVWLNFCHPAWGYAFAPVGDGSGYTFESGDGTGHAAFHTDKRQRSKYNTASYRVRYVHLPTDAGDLAPVGTTPTPLDWGYLGNGVVSDRVREFSGAMAWVVKNKAGLPNLDTTDTTKAQTWSTQHRSWCMRFQVQEGLPATGVVTPSVLVAIQKALRRLVGA